MVKLRALDGNTFTHTASTDKGSSGGPIFSIEDDDMTFLGLHRGSDKDHTINFGNFISPVLENMNQITRNGYGKEYYKKGNIKYEGYFMDDKYDNEYDEKKEGGKYYEENGDIYIGEFKNGKKNGNGILFDRNNEIKYAGEFKDDQPINYTKESEDKNDDNDKNNNNDNIHTNEGNNYDDKNEDNDGKNDNQINNIENNNDYNNQNDYNNNDNNQNDSNNNNTDFIKELRKNICLQFHDLGNMLGFKCMRCTHPTKSHTKLVLGEYECSECPHDDNICRIK